jgi:DNA-binding GntR family transcriptional regulator
MSADQIVERAAGQLWLFSAEATSAEGIASSYEYRLVLEPAALASKSFSVDVSALAAIRRSLEAVLALGEQHIDMARFEPVDFEFHAMIARGCANPYISSALAAHHRKRRTAMRLLTLSSFRLMESTREHLAILSAIEQGQFDTAADLMRVHLRMSQAQRPVLLGRGVPFEMRGTPR